MPTSQVLIVDTDSDTASMAREGFRDANIRFVSVRSSDEAEDELAARPFDVVLADLSSDDGAGFALLKRIRLDHPRLPVIASSRASESGTAIEAVKAGAFDFLAKPFDREEMVRALGEALEVSKKTAEPVAINPQDAGEDSTETLVGNSRAMLDVYKSLGRISATPVAVLIRGETGTGKELVARAIYQHGHRAHKPFVTVNCAAIPENLLESELFGHEKGAFTGAVATRIGKFEQANNATLFLDEIGDLDLSLQAKLLRVLQEKRFQRVGGSSEISVDVRIIAATHRPIEEMINDGSFREDLFYRLNVATIKLPPLRDRTGDTAQLTAFFLRRFGVELDLPSVPISRAALSRLESARLPGNVRQLQNIVRKALLRSRGYPIDREMIENLLEETEPSDTAAGETASIREFCRKLVSDAAAGEAENVHEAAIEKIEGPLIEEALRRSEGNITRAATWLGLSRLTVREKSKKYGIGNGRNPSS